jgi:hypothetical protein
MESHHHPYNIFLPCFSLKLRLNCTVFQLEKLLQLILYMLCPITSDLVCIFSLYLTWCIFWWLLYELFVVWKKSQYWVWVVYVVLTSLITEALSYNNWYGLVCKNCYFRLILVVPSRRWLPCASAACFMNYILVGG